MNTMLTIKLKNENNNQIPRWSWSYQEKFSLLPIKIHTEHFHHCIHPTSTRVSLYQYNMKLSWVRNSNPKTTRSTTAAFYIIKYWAMPQLVAKAGVKENYKINSSIFFFFQSLGSKGVRKGGSQPIIQLSGTQPAG